MHFLIPEPHNILFQDVCPDYFRGYCENVEEIYKRGLDFADTELADNLKYKQPERPSGNDQKHILLISDKDEYVSVKRNMDKLKRSGVWVCRKIE